MTDENAIIDYWPWTWLASTHDLQQKFFGVRFPLEGEELANYVMWNHSALVVEASELLAEFGWKPWSQPRGWVNREAALGEAVDVAHFLGNILCAIGVTDEEWVAAYQRKQEVNRQRQRGGYDARAGKCRGCGRAYDDVAVQCRPGDEVEQLASSGHVTVYYELGAWCQVQGYLTSASQVEESDDHHDAASDTPDRLRVRVASQPANSTDVRGTTTDPGSAATTSQASS